MFSRVFKSLGARKLAKKLTRGIGAAFRGPRMAKQTKKLRSTAAAATSLASLTAIGTFAYVARQSAARGEGHSFVPFTVRSFGMTASDASSGRNTDTKEDDVPESGYEMLGPEEGAHVATTSAGFGGNNVLVCMDASINSREALRHYAERLRRPADHVTVIHVIDLPPRHIDTLYGYQYADATCSYAPGAAGVFPSSYEAYDDAARALFREERERGKRYLRTVAQKCNDTYGFTPEMVIGYGDPKRNILKYVQKEPQDVVVCASRGLGTVKRLFLGSVSDYLVHHCTTSVLVVHAGGQSK